MQPDHLSPAAQEIFAAVTALEPQFRDAAPAIDADRRLPPHWPRILCAPASSVWASRAPTAVRNSIR